MRTRKLVTGGLHTEWMSLIEISGPFLSQAELTRVFPQGLDVVERDRVETLRLAWAEWRDFVESSGPTAMHRAWVMHVLKRVLGHPDAIVREGETLPNDLDVEVREHQESLRPDLAIVDPNDSGRFVLLVSLVPPNQGLERPLTGRLWKASPVSRMVELLRGADVKLGLVTNGEQWTLVHAPRSDTASLVSWEAGLWFEEALTLRALTSLLGAGRFFGAAPGDSLEELFANSVNQQQEVTETLGLQVRRSVETLVSEWDRIDRSVDGKLLADFSEREVYEAAVNVMMRLVFLLYAEEQGLLPLGDPFYDENYAVSTLHDSLQTAAAFQGDGVLQLRTFAWGRLVATFRAIHSGADHDVFHMPAYGGSLFDPDRFPFLEGRSRGTTWKRDVAQPIAMDDFTVLQLLTSIQYLGARDVRSVAESRRLSFRSLGVEQIGHVYESLLDHTARRAADVVLGLIGKAGEEPEVVLRDLEDAKRAGASALTKLLQGCTGKNGRTLERLLAQGIDAPDRARWLAACDNDPAVLARVEPFAGVIRDDVDRAPLVIPARGLFVTRGSDRRSTGTHYTPPSLTEPIVKHALDPLVYSGPKEGWPETAWKLKSPRELLELRVCDLAMGSAAFLVQTCRFLAEKLVEAWEILEREHPGKLVVTPEGDLSIGDPRERSIPRDAVERRTLARRVVASRCIYGVDRDPMAVEMAKLSIWLVTMEKGKPFTFIDHAFKSGDALLGVTSAEQLDYFELMPAKGTQRSLYADSVRESVEMAKQRRQQVESFVVNDVRDLESKAALLREADRALELVRVAADALVAATLVSEMPRGSRFDALRIELLVEIDGVFDAPDDERQEALEALLGRVRGLIDRGKPPHASPRRPMHWWCEFPEIFAGGGFSAFVGNPPFQGGQRITGEQGTDYRNYLVNRIASGARGSADLCAYMFLRIGSLLRPDGTFGLLATNTISQGDTREVGLDQMLRSGLSIYRAIKSQKWPGTANLEVAAIWATAGRWSGRRLLEEQPVAEIDSMLTEPGMTSGKPHRLEANAAKSFIGSLVLGLGFTLEVEEARALVGANPANEMVLFPYLTGQDVNRRPDQSPSRWVINFHDWPLDRDAAPEGYKGPVAADFPEPLEIVERLVKPQRDNVKRERRRERWWQFAETAPGLYKGLASRAQVLVRARVSEYHLLVFVPANLVISEAAVVLIFDDLASFGLLQSCVHEFWAREYASSLRKDMRYTPSDCFDTWPFPDDWKVAEQPGRALYDHRSTMCMERNLGLTKIYNLIHDPRKLDADVAELRRLHVELDAAACAAYGWTDIDLGHDFRDTPRGPRYWPSQTAVDELLERLLRLNHARHAEEVG